MYATCSSCGEGMCLDGNENAFYSYANRAHYCFRSCLLNGIEVWWDEDDNIVIYGSRSDTDVVEVWFDDVNSCLVDFDLSMGTFPGAYSKENDEMVIQCGAQKRLMITLKDPEFIQDLQDFISDLPYGFSS